MSEIALRPLDQAVQRWVLAHGGSPALATIAARASAADGEGDTVLPLAPDEAAALRGQPMLAEAADAPKPFVLDAADRFYLWRNHADESAALAALLKRWQPGPAPSDATADIDHLLPPAPGVDDQRRALQQVSGQRLFVLTGGPGTGKTTTVLRMLWRLQEQAAVPLRIALAAPTGKAAQRLAQSLQQGIAQLSAQMGEDARSLHTFTDLEATTVHRLLGYQPWRNGYRHHAGDPLAADVVVIDEASMLDLGMLRALLDAVAPQATLLLVGDADQLPSVGAGSVLRDLVSALQDSRQLVALRHSFRATTALSALNAAVRTGDAPAVVARFGDAQHAAQTAVGNEADVVRLLNAWVDDLLADPALTATATQPQDALPPIAALTRRQLLCAVRQGPYGVEAANVRIERRLRRARGVPADAVWYPGRIVMITRNEPSLGLFNGDIGVCLADADGHWRIWFAAVSAAGQPMPKACLPSMLPPHETAFAITIHKSQGSEYDTVAVLLPPDPTHRLLNRALLYTGVSRARQQVRLWCSDAVLQACLARPAQRVTALGERLIDARTDMNNDA